MMRGNGAPTHTVFGVIGSTINESSAMRSLGGIIKDTKGGKPSHGTVMKAPMARSKTCIPGAHYAQVPYPGQFFTNVGKTL
jgi:hypothetical protein